MFHDAKLKRLSQEEFHKFCSRLREAVNTSKPTMAADETKEPLEQNTFLTLEFERNTNTTKFDVYERRRSVVGDCHEIKWEKITDQELVRPDTKSVWLPRCLPAFCSVTRKNETKLLPKRFEKKQKTNDTDCQRKLTIVTEVATRPENLTTETYYSKETTSENCGSLSTLPHAQATDVSSKDSKSDRRASESLAACP